MKQVIVISLISILLLPVSAFGFDFMFSGFGTDPFDFNNNWSPIEYSSGVGHLPSPGYLSEGGEKFDLEGLFVNVDLDTKLFNLALTKSFGQTVYSTTWGQTYGAGDIFIDFGTGERFAIDVSTGHLWRVGGAFGISDLPGSHYGDLAIRNAVGAYLIDPNAVGSQDLGGITFKESFLPAGEVGYLTPGNGDTWVWEYAFSIDLLGKTLSEGDELFIHNTLECGNDYIEGRFNPVPEPTTLILFGSGLLGLKVAAQVKRKRRA